MQGIFCFLRYLSLIFDWFFSNVAICRPFTWLKPSPFSDIRVLRSSYLSAARCYGWGKSISTHFVSQKQSKQLVGSFNCFGFLDGVARKIVTYLSIGGSAFIFRVSQPPHPPPLPKRKTFCGHLSHRSSRQQPPPKYRKSLPVDATYYTRFARIFKQFYLLYSFVIIVECLNLSK